MSEYLKLSLIFLQIDVTKIFRLTMYEDYKLKLFLLQKNNIADY
jgi:hypothetical protein